MITEEWNIVLEPCIGSGTIFLAAKHLGRNIKYYSDALLRYDPRRE